MNISHYPVDSNKAKLVAIQGINQSKYLHPTTSSLVVIARAMTAKSIAVIIPLIQSTITTQLIPSQALDLSTSLKEARYLEWHQ